MIRPIDIKLNAAHPELPLVEATTFTGAPSSVFIRGVPKSVGNWSITAVNVAVTYPDNSTTARAAVESAEGVWVATIPGTATSGRTVAGFRILADGIDENGAAVTGYVLGFADFSVLSFTPVPAPGGTFWLLRYFDAMPTTPKKGDVAVVGGVLKYYNGTAWLPFADLTNYYTKAETDEAIDKLAAYYITADAQGNPFATHAALVNAQTYYSGGAVRTPTRNDYAVVSADETHGGAEWRYIYAVDAQGVGQWEPQYAVEGVIAYDDTVTRTSANGVKSSGIWSAIWGALAALPTGFTSLYDWCVAQLAGKQSTLSAQQLANIAAVSDALSFDATHSYAAGDPVVYNGTLYTFTAAHTGAWTGSDVSAVDIIARLAGKLASTSAAPAFTAKTYAVDDLCTYNSAIYRCKVGYTATASSAKPDTDATHWEAKLVSDMFLRAAHLVTEVVSESRQFADVPGVVVFNPNGVSYLSQLSEPELMMLLQNGGVVDAFGNAMCFPTRSATSNKIYDFALAASNPTAGNLAALDAQGNPTDSGYHFEVRNGIPCIVQYT